MDRYLFLLSIVGKIAILMVPIGLTLYYVVDDIREQRKKIFKKPNILHKMGILKKQSHFEIAHLIFGSFFIFLISFLFAHYILIVFMTFYFAFKFNEFGKRHGYECFLTITGFLSGMILAAALVLLGRGEHIIGTMMLGPVYNIFRIAYFFDQVAKVVDWIKEVLLG